MLRKNKREPSNTQMCIQGISCKVMNAHLKIRHGEVASTMTDIRGKYWMQRLCLLVKRIRRKCYRYKVFNAVDFQKPPPALFSRDQTVGYRASQVAGTHYAGPITFNKNQKTEGKAYIVLFTFSLSRAVHIESLRD